MRGGEGGGGVLCIEGVIWRCSQNRSLSVCLFVCLFAFLNCYLNYMNTRTIKGD